MSDPGTRARGQPLKRGGTQQQERVSAFSLESSNALFDEPLRRAFEPSMHVIPPRKLGRTGTSRTVPILPKPGPHVAEVHPKVAEPGPPLAGTALRLAEPNSNLVECPTPARTRKASLPSMPHMSSQNSAQSAAGPNRPQVGRTQPTIGGSLAEPGPASCGVWPNLGQPPACGREQTRTSPAHNRSTPTESMPDDSATEAWLNTCSVTNSSPRPVRQT